MSPELRKKRRRGATRRQRREARERWSASFLWWLMHGTTKHAVERGWDITYRRLCVSCHHVMDGHVRNLGHYAKRKEVVP